jgi:hypothetical protein
MYKKVLILIFSLLLSKSIFAMDFNETSIIINEASISTQVLQNDFNTLLNETLSPEINNSKDSYAGENNQSIISHEVNISLEQNNSITDNNYTDSNLGTSAEGLLIFKTRIKPYCTINGDKFAKQYMQEDWDDIYHDKEFKKEVIKACPKIEKRYKDKWTPHLYQFSIEYASDSDAIPEC